ncbi:MAG: alginate export family protein [Bacteroidetes bacterium]|nr:alginate export family protein [Bacteroidota bacterium]
MGMEVQLIKKPILLHLSASGSRLEGSYKLSKLTFYTSIQDARTWGSTSQLNISDNAFSLHEAWAHIQLDTNFSLKVGRQELVYDNSRFLGNVDWALQGRSHDFALLKWVRKNTKIDIGAGYNQDGEALSGNILTVTNQYKTALLFRVEQKLEILIFFSGME